MANLNLKKNSVLLRPHITEKAVIGADKSGVYVFNVSKTATKPQIAASVKAQYKVTPIRVNVAKIADKKIYFRGKPGVKRGGKKAYVYLKKGDKIELL